MIHSREVEGPPFADTINYHLRYQIRGLASASYVRLRPISPRLPLRIPLFAQSAFQKAQDGRHGTARHGTARRRDGNRVHSHRNRRRFVSHRGRLRKYRKWQLRTDVGCKTPARCSPHNSEFGQRRREGARLRGDRRLYSPTPVDKIFLDLFERDGDETIVGAVLPASSHVQVG